MTLNVFVSYRRRDGGDFAAALVAGLRRVRPDFDVFIDSGGILPGDEFWQTINVAIGRCDVVLVVIGPDWVRELQSRIDSQQRDYVVAEIYTALRMRKRVIPLLLDGEAMPRPEVLPVSIHPLMRRNAVAMVSIVQDGELSSLAQALDRFLDGTGRPMPLYRSMANMAGPFQLAHYAKGLAELDTLTLVREEAMLQMIGGNDWPIEIGYLLKTSVAIDPKLTPREFTNHVEELVRMDVLVERSDGYEPVDLGRVLQCVEALQKEIAARACDEA